MVCVFIKSPKGSGETFFASFLLIIILFSFFSVFRPEGLIFHTGIFLTVVNFTGINSRYTGGVQLLTLFSCDEI